MVDIKWFCFESLNFGFLGFDFFCVFLLSWYAGPIFSFIDFSEIVIFSEFFFKFQIVA